MIAPEVGGGFGAKIAAIADEAAYDLLLDEARTPGEVDRDPQRENYQATTHGRDHVTRAAIALDAEHKIIGLRCETYAGLGAYLSTFAPAVRCEIVSTLAALRIREPKRRNLRASSFGLLFSRTASEQGQPP